MNQKGLSSLLIVILAAIALGGYFIYQKTSVPTTNMTPTPSPTTTQLIPSPKASPTSTPKPIVKKVSTPKPTTAATTPSPAPSQSPDSSPTSKPSPISGVYHLDLKPTSNIETSTSSYGYAASILLTDSNGDVVYDQSDISFSASIENPNLAQIQLDYDDGNQLCKIYNIKYQEGYHICPNFRLDIVPKQAGSTKIPVKATQKSTGKVVAEGTYSLTVK